MTPTRGKCDDDERHVMAGKDHPIVIMVGFGGACLLAAPRLPSAIATKQELAMVRNVAFIVGWRSALKLCLRAGRELIFVLFFVPASSVSPVTYVRRCQLRGCCCSCGDLSAG